LQVDYVVSQLVILGLNSFEVVVEHLVIADLFFELLDVTFFPLAERSLEKSWSAIIPNGHHVLV
jgi:hypothetical protein